MAIESRRDRGEVSRSSVPSYTDNRSFMDATSQAPCSREEFTLSAREDFRNE